MTTQQAQEDCVFCDTSKIKSKVFDHGNGVISFEPLNPVTKGHRLFVPKKHCEDFHDDPKEFAKVCETVALYSRGRGEYNIITSKGEDATQSVFHLHVHLIPRKKGDKLQLPWTENHEIIAQTLKDEREAIVRKIENLILSNHPIYRENFGKYYTEITDDIINLINKQDD